MNEPEIYEVPEAPYLVDAQRVDDFRTYETAPTLCSRMGTGGNNVPVLVVEVPCQVDGSPVASTLRGFGHGWQGQHNSTNSVVQEIADE